MALCHRTRHPLLLPKHAYRWHLASSCLGIDCLVWKSSHYAVTTCSPPVLCTMTLLHRIGMLILLPLWLGLRDFWLVGRCLVERHQVVLVWLDRVLRCRRRNSWRYRGCTLDRCVVNGRDGPCGPGSFARVQSASSATVRRHPRPLTACKVRHP